MGIQVFAGLLITKIPFSVQIVGHDIEEADITLKVDDIEVLEIPI
jgi:hypothetical protein